MSLWTLWFSLNKGEAWTCTKTGPLYLQPPFPQPKRFLTWECFWGEDLHTERSTLGQEWKRRWWPRFTTRGWVCLGRAISPTFISFQLNSIQWLQMRRNAFVHSTKWALFFLTHKKDWVYFPSYLALHKYLLSVGTPLRTGDATASGRHPHCPSKSYIYLIKLLELRASCDVLESKQPRQWHLMTCKVCERRGGREHVKLSLPCVILCATIAKTR